MLQFMLQITVQHQLVRMRVATKILRDAIDKMLRVLAMMCAGGSPADTVDSCCLIVVYAAA